MSSTGPTSQTPWKPSFFGRLFSASPYWALSLADEVAIVSINGVEHRIAIESRTSLQVEAGAIWSHLVIEPPPAQTVRLGGLPERRARGLRVALAAVLERVRIRQSVEDLAKDHAALLAWLTRVDALAHWATRERRWVTRDQQAELQRSRPSIDSRSMRRMLGDPPVRTELGPLATQMGLDLDRWDSQWDRFWTDLNEIHVRGELQASRDLFERAESKPLTEEQARAVVSFDNRVLVVAAAGSGKTSTMVARAAYAIRRGIVPPERIVMMAFNKKAAEELQERAQRAFQRLEMADLRVQASTFHALGLRIIGRATGRKPDVPDWTTDPALGFKKLQDLIEALKEDSSQFRTTWDLFRLIYGRSLPAFGREPTPDVWDRNGQPSNLTLRGERVLSEEEAMIANFAFYNGIDYQYERRYEFDTATADRRQYKPDFFYPAINLYHEHFALDALGQPPAHFRNYLEGVQWKRQLHKDRRTAFIETTSHELRNTDWTERLSALMTSRGLTLDPDPERPVPAEGCKPLPHDDLAVLIRTFISHVKSNSLTTQDLHRKVEALPANLFKGREAMFLRLALPVMQAWDDALAAEGGIDFEDMLNQAAHHLEQGHHQEPFQLVMADEFQDASRARARLCRALVRQPGSFFFAVGDDWQSINRFAGADVSVMTGFESYFGQAQVLKLEQTFRCPQALCDVASRFVTKNPAQMDKRVRSATPVQGPVLRAFQVEKRTEVKDAIARFLHSLCDDIRSGIVPGGRDGPASVMVLGRYRADRASMPEIAGLSRWLKLEFLTIHRSKGREADYVILPSMTSWLRGNSFPNTRVDDPVLGLAMPTGDDFPHGEERRLFYVAVTRARRGVVMFTVKGARSAFLEELSEDHGLQVLDTQGEPIDEENCPACRVGVLVIRNGPYGEFRSCSNYPLCEFKPRQGGTHARRNRETRTPL